MAGATMGDDSVSRLPVGFTVDARFVTLADANPILCVLAGISAQSVTKRCVLKPDMEGLLSRGLACDVRAMYLLLRKIDRMGQRTNSMVLDGGSD
jgi:hypothetical protein